MLKRSGRGHDPEGVSNTLFGECAVECPACPHPGKNLPEGWEDAPEAVRYGPLTIPLCLSNCGMVFADGYTR